MADLTEQRTCIKFCFNINKTRAQRSPQLHDPNFIFKVITVDESWVYGYHPETKQQSLQFTEAEKKLGYFLLFRVLKYGHDSRFDKVRGNPLKFLVYWTLQGVWVLLTLVPALILNFKQQDVPINGSDYAGWTLWTIGFLIETIADFQKYRFRANPSNKGKFIRTGLWSISRHPNYFGEILLWFGLFTSAQNVMKGKELFSVWSPMFVAFLLTKVSGIPLLEKAGFRRWGTSPAYVDYVQSTAVLIPLIW